MIVYIIRRLIVAILLLIVVCLATFCIFFVVPRLAGQTTDQLAAQYVGKNPNPATIHGIEVKLGLDKPIIVQFLDFLKGIDGVVSTEKAAAVKHGVSLRSHFYAGQRLPPFEPDRDQDGHDQGERDDYPDERVPAHRWIVGA